MRGAAAFVDRGTRTAHKCYSLYFAVEMLTTRDGPAVLDAEAGYWLKIVFLQLAGPRRKIAIRFGMEKLEWRR